MVMKKIYALVLVFILLVSLCSCGGGDNSASNIIDYEQEPISLVIIAGKHANSNNFSESMMEQAKDLITRSIKYEKDGSERTATADITLIVCDGKPRAEMFTIGNGLKLQTTANNEDLFEDNVTAFVNAIVEKLTGDEVRAKETGCDLQAALNQAKKVLNNKKTFEKHILILDTGISTEGNVDMRKLDFMTGTVDDVLSNIDSSAFTDLEGINVTFLGLGNVADPQPDLSESAEAEERLIDFWTIFLEDKCGATLTQEIYYEASGGDPLYSNENLENPYPYVPVVDFIEETEGGLYIPPITSAEIGFKPSSAEFKDASDAKKVLREYAAYLKDYFRYHPDKVVYIVGSIARTSANEKVTVDDKISRDRAEKIYNMLISDAFGFNSSQFIVIDAGTTPFSWRNYDEFPGGVYSPGNQEANRLVALIPETDVQHVQELKDAGEI